MKFHAVVPNAFRWLFCHLKPNEKQVVSKQDKKKSQGRISMKFSFELTTFFKIVQMSNSYG
jgi:hypothetical protein